MSVCLQEVTLASIPGANDSERLLVVLRTGQSSGTGSQLELRQQTWCEHVGWYTQSSVDVDSQQVAALRTALGGTAASGGSHRRGGQVSSPVQPSFAMRVVRAESA